MLRPLTFFILPALLLVGIGSDSSVAESKQNGTDVQVETVEKMALVGGNATLDINVDRLSDANASTEESKSASLRFTLAQDSFFTIIVTNDALRSPLSGSLGLVAQNNANLPAPLNASLRQLVLEKGQSDSDLVVRDAKTGFVFFNLEGQSYDYDAGKHLFRIQDARLLISEEFATALGQSLAGSIAGRISLSATTQTIEVTRYVNGQPDSTILPANGTKPGPDVIVGDVSGLAQFGSSSGTQVGLALGTDSCNAGVENLNWFALPNNDHPVIPQNLYRMSGGATNNERFEQIGQSNVKHAFTALTQNIWNF